MTHPNSYTYEGIPYPLEGTEAYRSLTQSQKTTHDRQERFLAGFAAGGNITAGLKVAEIDRRTQELWRSKDVFGFRARFNAAHLDYCDALESKMQELINELKPGNNPLILLARLNKEMPQSYRPGVQLADDTAKDVLDQLRKASRVGHNDSAQAIAAAEDIVAP
jgi:hypothetical protein